MRRLLMTAYYNAGTEFCTQITQGRPDEKCGSANSCNITYDINKCVYETETKLNDLTDDPYDYITVRVGCHWEFGQPQHPLVLQVRPPRPAPRDPLVRRDPARGQDRRRRRGDGRHRRLRRRQRRGQLHRPVRPRIRPSRPRAHPAHHNRDAHRPRGPGRVHPDGLRQDERRHHQLHRRHDECDGDPTHR